MESAERQARLEKLRREAETEMRRNLDDSGPPRKRSKRQGGPGGPGGAGRADFVPVDRYSYATIGELEAGTKGFLITTTFRREKSASREASQLLRRYMPAHLFPAPAAEQGQQQQQQQAEAQEQEQQKEQSGDGEQQQGKGTQGEAEAAGGRIVPGAKEDQEQGGGSRGGSGGAKGKRGGGGGDDGGDSGSEGDSDSDEEGGAEDAPNGTDTRRTGPSALGLVKIGCRGVVLMRLSAEAAAAVDPVAVLDAMLQDVEQGRLQQPRFCQRIVPLDSTCECTPEGWSRAAAQAAAAYRARRAAAAAAGQGASTPEAPIAFAVAIRTRSNEPTAAGAAEGAADGTAAEGERASGAGKDGGELDRPRMLSLAAAAMSEAFSSCGGAVVNLKKPQVAVLCETVPVAGRRFAGMCVVDQHLFQAKGKLILKALVKGAKP